MCTSDISMSVINDVWFYRFNQDMFSLISITSLQHIHILIKTLIKSNICTIQSNGHKMDRHQTVVQFQTKQS